ncbi:unnamed protein product [Clonostachys rosea f. rosea IK726]|uniref:Uncharacterized protein n=1 Tax=Clonostachys rosea f. rosea IK726 TaxID=1349383 RepID=A0ACA9UCS0_BIOOC|nr:unnamed protein product [Clonostachys rosea f. rosea IK726]
MSYRISAPMSTCHHWMGVETVKITKAAWIWPFRDACASACNRMTMHGPAGHDQGEASILSARRLHSRSRCQPAGANTQHYEAASEEDPRRRWRREDRGDALMKYAMLLADSDTSSKNPQQQVHVGNIVKGIIEGETRVLVSSMTMEEIFTEREVFKKRIFRNIRVKELKDAPNSVYFESLARKAHEGATNQARIDVADAQLRGPGDRQDPRRDGRPEDERDVERAKAEAHLQTHQVRFNRDVDLERTAAKRALEAKDEDLRKDVEIRRAIAETERLRAKDVVRATIERESKQQAADAAAYEVEAAAKAAAEGNQKAADGEAYAIAPGLRPRPTPPRSRQRLTASAVPRRPRVSPPSPRPTARWHCLWRPRGPAQVGYGRERHLRGPGQGQRDAIRGMAPKISVWNTGANGGAGGSGQQDPAETMRGVYQMLPPLMTTIHDQTGISLPEWQFGRMAAGTDAVAKEASRCPDKFTLELAML